MREIKFRAWNKKDNKMFIPSLGEFNDINDEIRNLQDEGIVFIQYTGLKDKNGVDIYEGDILGRCFDDYDENCEVLYMDGMLILKSGRSKTTRPMNVNKGFGWSELHNYINYRNGFEVIGNIYENKELLKM